MTQPGLAACVFLGTLAMGTNVRSSAVSASGRYRLLVSTPRKTISPAGGSGAKSTKTWRSCSASIWPSSRASYKLAQVRSKNGENDNSGKLWAPASLDSASTWGLFLDHGFDNYSVCFTPGFLIGWSPLRSQEVLKALK